jgi:hypothetical protein
MSENDENSSQFVYHLNTGSVLDNMNRQFWLTGLGLITLVICVYAQSIQFDFIRFDDYNYVVFNGHVNTGLSWANIYWAFTESHANNWHPMTWISHMLDVELFGLNPAGHHSTNLFVHALNCILLLLFFRLAGIKQLPAISMAILFGVHPMHVESVVWIAERKDVLSTFFMLLTLIAYSRYVRQRTIVGYIPIVIFYALGLMSKSMLVTLPFVLLLLDYFPFRRFDPGKAGEIEWAKLIKQLALLTTEKIPLFVLSLATMLVAYQTQEGALLSGASLNFTERLINAVVAYSHYVFKAIAPGNLAVLYPHPGGWPVLDLIKALALLAAFTTLALWNLRSRPYMIVGWLWFLGTLVPVIGLVQVGNQYMADRYSYIPYIGLFLMLVPFLFDLLNKLTQRQTFYHAIAVLLALVYGVSAAQYVTHWRDGISIFRHTLRVTDPNYEYFLGAVVDFEPLPTSLAGLWTSYYMMGYSLAGRGNFEQALRHLDMAIQLAPHLMEAHHSKAIALAALGRRQESVKVLR